MAGARLQAGTPARPKRGAPLVLHASPLLSNDQLLWPCRPWAQPLSWLCCRAEILSGVREQLLAPAVGKSRCFTRSLSTFSFMSCFLSSSSFLPLSPSLSKTLAFMVGVLSSTFSRPALGCGAYDGVAPSLAPILLAVPLRGVSLPPGRSRHGEHRHGHGGRGQQHHHSPAQAPLSPGGGEKMRQNPAPDCTVLGSLHPARGSGASPKWVNFHNFLRERTSE